MKTMYDDIRQQPYTLTTRYIIGDDRDLFLHKKYPGYTRDFKKARVFKSEYELRRAWTKNEEFQWLFPKPITKEVRTLDYGYNEPMWGY